MLGEALSGRFDYLFEPLEVDESAGDGDEVAPPGARAARRREPMVATAGLHRRPSSNDGGGRGDGHRVAPSRLGQQKK
jgi:hypothetical protein